MPLLKTDDNVIGKVIEERAIKQLPSERPQCVLFDPADTRRPTSNRGATGLGGDSQPRLSGGRSRTGEFLLDGTSVTDPRRGDTVIAPNLDAIQEFDVQTSGIPAEFGRLTGGIVTAALKSGTNQFPRQHFRVLSRQYALAARNFFSATVPRTGVQPVWRDSWRTHQTRSHLFLPGLPGNAKPVSSPIFNLTLPTPQQLGGELLADSGTPGGIGCIQAVPCLQGQIFDPATTRTAPSGQLVRDAFPGNVIPASRIDPIAARVVTPLSGAKPRRSEPELQSVTIRRA